MSENYPPCNEALRARMIRRFREILTGEERPRNVADAEAIIQALAGVLATCYVSAHSLPVDRIEEAANVAYGALHDWAGRLP